MTEPRAVVPAVKPATEYLIKVPVEATGAFEAERKRLGLNHQTVMNLHFARSKTNLLSNMVRTGKDAQFSSILIVAEALGLEVVVRRKPKVRRSEQMFDAIRAEIGKAE